MTNLFIGSDRRTQKETALFEAALDVFAEFGFRKAGIEDIARRAGIANGTVYLYAASKRDLYKRAVEYGLDAWQAHAAKAAEEAAEGTEPGRGRARNRFEALCRAAYSYLAAEPRLRRIMSRDPSLFPAAPGSAEGDDPFESVNGRSVAMLERAIREGVDTGEFAVEDPAAAAELLFSLYRVMIEKTYVEEDGGERKRFEAGLSIIMNGISARGA
ncbi:MAG: TetR/AcrR family transcriptional regulator [Spirochaetes bacterium]|nr:TetR/AcrR family transcriptional regulator [Spirochaetota bacterium]MBU1080125.1 TetR/AcrR family transcriptional regulator [Spirochaetota bacterium]